MRAIELRQLRYYVAVAQAGSFRKAAEALNISQPPLSVQVRQLEETLGMRLLDRDAAGVRVTESGKVFLAHATEILHRLSRAVAETQRAAAAGSSVLRLGCVSSGQASLLPSVLARVRGAIPGLDVEVQDLPTREQLLALADGTLDAGIIQLPAEGSGIAVAPLLADPLALIYADHFAALDGVADDNLLEAMGPLPFVGFSPVHASQLHAAQLACCRAAGFIPLARHSVRNAYGLIRYVEAGLGVSLMPSTYRSYLAPGTRCRVLPRSQGQLVLGLAWLPDRVSPLLGRILACLLPGPDAASGG
ncbi:LysR substrate-binding domain-containing protein [Pigmentiphaga sp.]|uniref:LysR family transcriptional regulator n=1 Tax=Pigmentiphaga sp. TaxID=1977564 RepID=UPI0025E91171|nr:LysR substrate-binding domain-containing protein [Pigmentiphaga sp.]